MGISCPTSNLSAQHTVRGIHFFPQYLRSDRLGKRRPSATRLKFIGRREQRFPRGNVYVNSFLKVSIILILVGQLRPAILSYMVLYVCQILSKNLISWSLVCPGLNPLTSSLQLSQTFLFNKCLRLSQMNMTVSSRIFL